MSTLCAIKGCPASYRTKKRGEKLYFFKPLKDQLEEWNRAIPGKNEIKEHDKVCSKHFTEDDLIKEWNFVIDDRTVTMPRGRWNLRVGAVPAIFDYADEPRVKRCRKSRPKSLIDYGESSSDVEHEERQRKREKKSNHSRSPKVVKNAETRVPEITDSDVKSNTRSSEGPSDERNQAADVEWEKVCDSLVDQLKSIPVPTPARVADAKPKKRPPGRPPKAGRGRRWRRRIKVRPGIPRKAKGTEKRNSVADISSSNDQATKMERNESSGTGFNADCETENSVIIEEFIASGCDENIDAKVSNAPGCSSRIKSNCPSNVTIKEEELDDGYERNESAVNRTECCSVTTICDDPTPPERPSLRENDRHCERVVVKREICDCEGEDSQCCEPEENCGQTAVELPACPGSRGERDPKDPQIPNRKKSKFPEGEINHNRLSSKIGAPGIPTSPVATATDTCLEGRSVSRQAARDSPTRTPTPTSRCMKRPSQNQVPEIDLEKLPRSSKNQPQVEEDSEVDMDFRGFPSDEDDELTQKRKRFQNTRRIKLDFGRLRKCRDPKERREENVESPPLTGDRIAPKRESNGDIGFDKSEDVESQFPASSSKPPNHTKEDVQKEGPAPKIQTTSVQARTPGNGSELITGRSRQASNYDEVLKSGRISDEVTVTKAPKSSTSLEKVTTLPNPSLDKVVSSSNRGLISGNFDLKTNFSMKNLNQDASSINYPLNDKILPTSNQDRNGHGIFRDKGTSTVQNELLKDKIPKAHHNSTATLSHLLGGSSIDRIIQSTRSASLMDNVISHAADPTVDKTSLILKNFKSDGVLALECVVLKEQVRQLQKELFIHKQMLIDSEHNASLLQRRLELQAQLPCANCMNIKQGLIGKETLI